MSQNPNPNQDVEDIHVKIDGNHPAEIHIKIDGNHQAEKQNRYGGWHSNTGDTLLLVATLITTLLYQLGTNIPGGFWQDDGSGHSAGDPIMRDKHKKRYWLFMSSSWLGFGSSMLLTLCLLTGVPAKSRRIKWMFIVSYSNLVLSFITSQAGTSLEMDLGIWVAVLFLLWGVVTWSGAECWKHPRRFFKSLFCQDII